jgi:HAD superfamily hydrolase (TIGR01549 family)
VLFDMDGTVTEPMLDFPAIKAEMGIGNRPILEALAELEATARQAAEAVLLRYEEHAAKNSRLNQGARELLDWLRGRQIATALITRNSRLSVQTVLARHGLSFDVLVTREDGPFKPDPRPLLLACHKLSVLPHEAWMIGDGQYDVEAGAAAKIPTLWLSHGRRRPFDAIAWREAVDLPEALELLKHCDAHKSVGVMKK